MATLSYYFKSQTVFKYNTADPFLSSIGNNDSNAAPVTLPNNDSSIPVMKITSDDGGMPDYFTLNQIYISQTSLFNNRPIENSIYQLIIQGNLDNFNVNSNNQILIIIPIFTNVESTIEKSANSITNMNSTYLNSIFNNMTVDGRQNFANGIDFNQFLTGISKGNYYANVTDTTSNPTTVYTIIQYNTSNLYQNITLPSWIKLNLAPSMPKYDAVEISTVNNITAITKITEQDIYIDCSPTNNLGQPVDIYTSKNLDQLKMFEINDLKIWAFRVITILVIILIVFVIIKMFQIDSNPAANTTNANVVNASTSPK
jgi:hypothetical protein